MKNVVLFFIFFCLITTSIFSQNTDRLFLSQDDLFGCRTFVENKGQFDHLQNENEKIFFAVQNGQERIYFTSHGFYYEIIKEKSYSDAEKEEIEKGDFSQTKPVEKYKVFVRWQNANNTVEPTGRDPLGHYFTYGEQKYNAWAFGKLTYYNVYNHIDIEFIFPPGNLQGIKYNLILHPGADICNVEISYSGDVKKMKIDHEGNILIKTPVYDLTEHLPTCFYKEGGSIFSRFILKGKNIRFEFPHGYNTRKTIIVDPWVSSAVTLANNNYGYDVDFDSKGNLYVYGGNPPAKLAKYSPAGTLLWTFSGTINSPSWQSSGLSPTYAANFAVNKVNGKTFLGEALNSMGTRIVRLDTMGNYDNMISNSYATFTENWDIGYYCHTDKIIVMGGGTPSQQSAGILDQATGNFTPVAFDAQGGNSHDVVSHSIDEQGEIFWLYASTANSPMLNNMLTRINSAFTSSVWLAPSTFSSMNEAVNKGAFVGGAVPSNGFNCLAVNTNFLYYYDGYNLAAYSKLTGAIIASTTLTAQTIRNQGGIAVDNCDKLYLGGNGQIHSFHFNGANFSPLPGIPLGITSLSNQYVCDIKLDNLSKLLFVSGSGFSGVYSAVNSTTCSVSPTICGSAPAINHIICRDSMLMIAANNFAGLSNASYSLQPGGSANTTGTFAISPTVTTNYTITVSGTSSGSVGAILFSTISVTVNPTPTIIALATPSVICVGDSSKLTANGALTYLWCNNSAGYSSWVFPSTSTTYSVVGTSAQGCASSATCLVDVEVCLSMSEIVQENDELLVYPNPADGVFKVKTNDVTKAALCDYLGRKLMEFILNEKNDFEVSVKDIPRGVYFLSLESSRSRRIRKVVVN